MYCPKCLNNTLRLSSKGVIQLLINSKRMDTGLFLYDLSNTDKTKIVTNLKLKVEEFFRWYSGFNNPEPIHLVELVTSDVVCDNACRMSGLEKFSVVDILVTSATLVKLLNEIGDKYKLSIELK